MKRPLRERLADDLYYLSMHHPFIVHDLIELTGVDEKPAIFDSDRELCYVIGRKSVGQEIKDIIEKAKKER